MPSRRDATLQTPHLPMLVLLGAGRRHLPPC